ncbi:MAG: TonB-dependent receptor [Sphingobacteriales bacterium]|nr:TonB-dependent receptor [Sphingobacteriales bacterium]OJY84402.1 MAG: TonB-dependent receptor [Sphingobacteriales bacterium 44-15]
MKLFFLSALLLLTGIAFSQNAIIKGTVTTSDGKPAEAVTVLLKPTAKATAADRNGYYELKNIKPGNYTISTSFVGLETQEQKVQVRAGQTLAIDFALKESEQQLQEVIISARKNAGRTSEYVSKMPLKNLENPQVYNTVSAEILKQQVITTYDDALKNVPGIQRLWESTGRGGDGASYFTLRGFEAQVTMLNGLPGITSGSLDPANIEKIEVIKGPSGTLFGSNVIGYGGMVNNVTKKPYEDLGGEITYTGGSFGLNRIAADINLPLNKEKGIAARINTAYQYENSFQDQGFRKSFFFAPTISYKVNDKLSFLVVTEFMQEEKTNPTMLFLGRDSKLQFKDLADLNYNNKLSLTSNDLSIKNPRYNLQGQMIYKLSGNWTSQTVLSRGQSNTDGYYSYLYDNENGHRDFGLWISKDNSYTAISDIQQNFIGDFKIGSFRNRVVAGLDYFDRKIVYSGTSWGWVHNVNAQGEVNYIDPYTDEETAPVYLTKQSVDNLLAGTGVEDYSSKDRAYSAYVSDVFNITPALMAMASIRFDYFDNSSYHQVTASPKFGLIYQPIQDKLSVFGNYMNGFRNIAPAPLYAEDDDVIIGEKAFKPEHANQLEFGIKTNLFNNRLNSTISYYDIEVANQTMPDPESHNPLNQIQGGKSRSRGIEVDINANPVEGLNILAGYSYNYSNVLKGEALNIWFEQGKRPIWAGPKNLVNVWATYAFSSGAVKGLGAGLGGNYASDNATLNNTLTGTFILPAYTIINASVFYNTGKFRITCNLNNVTNKEYYGGGWSTVNPQKPRNFVASVAYKF